MKQTSKWILGGLLAPALWMQPSPVQARESSGSLDVARQLNEAFIEVADRVSPAVVVITVAHKPDYNMGADSDNPLWEWFPPQFRQQFEGRPQRENSPRQRSRSPVFDGQGSGVVIRPDGYILTNRHVVDGAEKIKVRFKDGKEYEAEIRGLDPQSDVAVIKIDAKGLPVAEFADSDKVKVGEFAIAIGAPFDLDYSVTFGHVSAKGRSRIVPDASMDQDFIQTDANINPGNSGGPLVNIDGKVMGINTLIKGLHTGIGFAIPSNLAREVSNQLVTDGKFTRAWLGVEIRALKDYVDYRDMAKNVQDGVVITGIRQDGPAAKSDLKLGDVITSVDGKPVSNGQQLKNEIRSKKVGNSVNLEVVRAGKSMTLKVRPEEWPDDIQPAVARRSATTPEAESADLGLTLKPITKEFAKEHALEVNEGMFVTQVERGSVAHQKGIQPGDVITEINQESVATLKDYKSATKHLDLKKGVVLSVVSQGVSRLVVLKDAGE